MCLKAAHQVASLPTSASQPGRQPRRRRIRGKKSFFKRKTPFLPKCSTKLPSDDNIVSHSRSVQQTKFFFFNVSAPLEGDNGERAVKGSVLNQRNRKWMKLHHRRFCFHEKHKLNSSGKTQKCKRPGDAAARHNHNERRILPQQPSQQPLEENQKKRSFFSFLTAVTGASRPAEMHLNIILITQRVTAAALTLVASGKQRPQNRRKMCQERARRAGRLFLAPHAPVQLLAKENLGGFG